MPAFSCTHRLTAGSAGGANGKSASSIGLALSFLLFFSRAACSSAACWCAGNCCTASSILSRERFCLVLKVRGRTSIISSMVKQASVDCKSRVGSMFARTAVARTGCSTWFANGDQLKYATTCNKVPTLHARVHGSQNLAAGWGSVTEDDPYRLDRKGVLTRSFSRDQRLHRHAPIQR